jgi:hypothetical protein
MRLPLALLACLGVAACSTAKPDTLPADVWLCAFQVGARYPGEAVKPDVIKYDLVPLYPVRRITLTYELPVNAQEPDTSHNHDYAIDTAQGRTAAAIREQVRQSGVHVHIPGIEGF